MGMPASVSGDINIGHQGFSPSPIITTAVTVLLQGRPPNRIGDQILVHFRPKSSIHQGIIASASANVLADGKGIARLMDKGNCGAIIQGTAGSVIVGG